MTKLARLKQKLKSHYNAEQVRDYHGRWTSKGSPEMTKSALVNLIKARNSVSSAPSSSGSDSTPKKEKPTHELTIGGGMLFFQDLDTKKKDIIFDKKLVSQWVKYLEVEKGRTVDTVSEKSHQTALTSQESKALFNKESPPKIYAKDPEKIKADSNRTKKEKAKELIQSKKKVVSSPENNADDITQKWSAAWKDSPKELQKVIDKLPKPVGSDPSKPIQGQGAAYYQVSDNSINMKNLSSTSEKGLSTWRHEYGHYLDYEAAQHLGGKKISAALEKQGLTLDKFKKIQSNPDFMTRMNTNSEVFKTLGVKLNATTPVDLKDLAALAMKAQGGAMSTSPTGVKATKKDEEHLLSVANRATEGYLKTFEEIKNEYPASVSKQVKLQEAKEEQIVKVHSEITNGNYYSQNEDRNKQYLDYGDRNLKNDPSIAGDIFRDRSRKTEEITELIPQLLLYKKNQDPQILANLIDHEYTKAGTANDLLGAITRNKVGHGHSDDYYRKDPNSQHKEAWANINDLHGHGSPTLKKALNILAPNSYKFYQKVIKDVAKD